ncbi:nucleoside kinase [Peptococcaceae bacterium 1198_IL3148]
MTSVNITINGEKHSFEVGTTLATIANSLYQPYSMVLGVVNNELKELSYALTTDAEVRFLDLTTTDGQKCYKRSLSFLFVKAFSDIDKEANIELCHTLSKGQYCIVKGCACFNQKTVQRVKKRMLELVKQDIPFIKEKLPVDEAVKLFEQIGRPDKIHLFKHIDKETVNIYNLDGYKDYFYGYLVPSTGYLKLFDVIPEDDGVVLLCPKKSNPEELTQHMYQPKLLKAFRETKDWANIMGVNMVGDLNEIIVNKEYSDLIRTVEALHENKIIKIADEITKHPTKGRVVLIAGPSSSGKTTFSRRLATQLKVNGLKPVAISLDDYFVDREDTPMDKDGNYDFESIYALDLKLFNQHLTALLCGEEVELPYYNFKKGKREYTGHKLRVNEKQPIILEGIHGLNNLLTSSVPDHYKFKIYISPLTQLNLDYHNRISTTDSRLIRRIVRDYRFRGHDAQATIKMWPSVRRGEEKNIFPYQEQADAMFNSTLIYELAVLKKYALPLLQAVKKDQEGYIEAKRLLRFLKYFRDIEDELDIPPTSIIKEFIGGSRIV